MPDNKHVQRDGDDHSGAEEWTKLIDSYKAQLNSFPDPRQQAHFYYVIGQLTDQRLRSDRGAVASYQLALKLDPTHRAAMRAIQRIFLRNDNWNGALKYTEMLIAHADGAERAEHCLEKGRLLEHTAHDLSAAMQCYEESLAAAGPRLEVLLALEGIYRKSKSWQKLVDVCQQQFPLLDDPELRATAHVKLGRLYEQQLHRPGVAKEHYRTALRICPSHRSAFHAITALLRRNFNWTELAEFYEEAAASIGEIDLEAECLSRLADLYQDQFLNPEQAVGYLRNLHALRPDHALTTVRLVTLYCELGRAADAVPLIREQALAASTPRDGAEHYYRLATLCETQLDDLAQAREACLKALELKPDHQEASVALSRIDAGTNNWSAIAEGTLRLAEQQIGNGAKAQRIFEAAEIYLLKLDDRKTAERHLRDAIGLDPGGLPAIKLLSRLYVDDGRHGDLVALIEQQLAHSSSREQSIFLLEKLAGVHLRYLADGESAAACYQRILDLRSDDLNALRALGRLYFQMECWEPLIGINGREAELSQEIAHIVNLLTRNGEIAEEQLNDDDRAVQWYEKALNVSPNFLPAMRPLERIYSRQGKWTELLRVYERQRQVVLDPQSRAGLEFTIASLKAQHLHDVEGAKIAFQAVLSAIPDHEPTLQALEGIYKSLGDWESLRILWEQRLHAMAPNASARDLSFALGQLWDRQLKRPYQAVAAYLRCLQIAPTYQPVKDAIVRVLQKAEDFPSLLDFYQKELDTATDDRAREHALQQLAALWRNQLNNVERAADYYEQLLRLNSTDFNTFSALEEIYQQLGNHEKLVEHYKAIAQQTSARDFALTCLLRAAEVCLLQLGSSERALELFGIVLANDPQNLHAMNRMEEIFYKRQKWRDLMMLLRQRAQLTSEEQGGRGLQYRLALVYELLNKHDAALQILRKVVTDAPDDIPAVLAIARVLAAQGKESEALRHLAAIPKSPRAPQASADDTATDAPEADAAAPLAITSSDTSASQLETENSPTLASALPAASDPGDAPTIEKTPDFHPEPSSPKVIIDEGALIPETGGDASQNEAPDDAAPPAREETSDASTSKPGRKRKGKRKR